MIWHHESPEAIAAELETDLQNGLTTDEAATRLQEYGHNRYFEKKSLSLGKQLGKQMKSLPTLLLVIAIVWMLGINILTIYQGGSASLWAPLLSLILLPAGHLMCALWQKRATSHLHRLHNVQSNNVIVLRDGEWQSVSAANIVRGDVLQLDAGMIVPADCRLVESEELYCDERVLTGEETDMIKNAEPLLDGITPMVDRLNMVYAGSGISHGTGVAIVVTTGFSTEYAIIQNQAAASASPLPAVDKDVSLLERLTSLPVLLLSLILLVLSIFLTADSFLGGVSPALAMAAVAIPSCLSVTAVIAMAMGMQHVVSRSADIRDLSVMDTLSRVSVICADKTGTLTSDEKKPVSVYTGDETEMLSRMPSNRAQTLIQLATLCTANDTQKTGRDNLLIGNPTEAAIIEYARDIGIERRTLIEESPRLAEIPFDTERRRMSVVHLVAGHKLMITMGAPENVLACCTSGPLEKVEEAIEEMGRQALRVLAVAYRYVDDLTGNKLDVADENDMIFAGLIALADQPRDESVQAIAECAKGGITTVMMTGDNPATAIAVAGQLGILHEESQLITGEQLQELSDEDLRRQVTSLRIYARITPEDKLRVIRAWQSNGAIVAVTGSELTDVPALQTANVGCATGAADCDMTRSASDLTLHDNSFATLVDVLKQARGIYANIRKALQYTLTCSLGLIVAMLLTVIAGRQFIVTLPSMMIFWVVGLAANMAIGYEAADRHALSERARRGIARLMPPAAWINTLWQGVVMGVCSFCAFDFGQSGAAVPEERIAVGLTTAFITLILSRLWLMLAIHRDDNGQKRAANRIKPLIFTISFIVMALLCVLAPVGAVFGLMPVLPSNWLVAVILSVIPAALAIIVRFVSRMLITVKKADRPARAH